MKGEWDARRETADVHTELPAGGRPLLRRGLLAEGDLWEEFAARADEAPGQAGAVLADGEVTYAELRRAAVALSARLAAARRRSPATP